MSRAVKFFWKRKAVRYSLLGLGFFMFSSQLMTFAQVWSNRIIITKLAYPKVEHNIPCHERTDTRDDEPRHRMLVKVETGKTMHTDDKTDLTSTDRSEELKMGKRYSSEEKTTNHYNPSQTVNISSVYQRRWVGFPDMINCSCDQMLTGPTNNSLYQQHVQRLSTRQILVESMDCNQFNEKFGFMRYPPVSVEEREFPLAYIILFHRNLDQVLFLLRAIYRPHNVHCLTMDTTSEPEILSTAMSLARCLPNVFVASKLNDIVYAGFSRLMADVDCMADLVRHPVQWKYVINMPGEQFPLRTNLELVQILKIFNGSNNLEVLTDDKALIKYRYMYKAVYIKNAKTGIVRIKKGFKLHQSPPHGFQVAKGSTYGCFSRQLVDFLFSSQAARDLLEWSRDVISPDEYFWATLHYSQVVKVPGSLAESTRAIPYITSMSVWRGGVNSTCATKYVHDICIFSPEDVSQLVNSGNLFANKFYIDHHPAALHCLDEMLLKHTFSGTARDFSLP